MHFYHLSSHLGDEYMIANAGRYRRFNYSRDAIVLGGGYYWTDDLRVYGEVGYAFSAVGGAEPWEMQFGTEYCPWVTSLIVTPFVAANVYLREDVDFWGNFTLQMGWQWRRVANGRVCRFGAQYFEGKNDQYEFLHESERKLGFGLWFDF
jgi:hypothetical protein